MEVTGARRSCGRRRVPADDDVADDVDRPNTNQRSQGVLNNLATKIGSERRKGAAWYYLNRSPELDGGSVVC